MDMTLPPGLSEIAIHRKPRYASGDLNRPLPNVALTPEVSNLLDRNAVVAIGVSGGKDSDACALATNAYLNTIGHKGPRVLVHADLGRVEWKDSMRACQDLASHLGLELMVVRRQAGDMMDRWQGRWSNNLARYKDFSCVKLILPWSTPSMRFCTSELKVDVITRSLKKRFPGQDIVNVSGIRREESNQRKKAPVSQPEAKLKRKDAMGLTWNAVIEWKIEDVMAASAQAGLRLHEAYSTYSASRVSCIYCIYSTLEDLQAGASCEDNHDVYREMVELEVASTFAFQGNRWLADAAPHLLTSAMLQRVATAKDAALRRQALESEIPKHLLYTKNWPDCIPTFEEAKLLARVRTNVAQLVEVEIGYTTPEEVIQRYTQLMAEKTNVL